MNPTLTVGTLLLLVLSVIPAASQTTTVDVQGGSLVLDHPKDWRASVKGPLAGPTLELRPDSRGDFDILITAIVSQRSFDDATVARMVRDDGDKRLSTSVQSKLEVRAVNGEQAHGYVFHLTDRNPEKGPGDFRELHQGVVVVGPLVLSTTVLTHSTDLTTVEAALKAIASARYVAARR